MEEDFRALLVGAPSVGLSGTHVNFGTHPQGLRLPAIVLTVVDSGQGLTLDGPDGLWDGRVQVDCYGDHYDDAKRLSRAVISTLSGHSDDAFQGIFHVATRDTHETGATDRPFRVSLDFSTHWSE